MTTPDASVFSAPILARITAELGATPSAPLHGGACNFSQAPVAEMRTG